MDELVGREKDFYVDQLTEQEGRLRKELDEEYETEQQIMCEELAEQKEHNKQRKNLLRLTMKKWILVLRILIVNT